MCENCNYTKILEQSDLEPTANRVQVLEVIGNTPYPLSAADIYATISRHQAINRVTVYRILDLLVEKDILERLSTGGRAAHFGLAPNEHHARHAHFYCTRCGQMDCLQPQSMSVDTGNLQKTFPGEIDRIEIRVDGTCKNCLKLQNQR